MSLLHINVEPERFGTRRIAIGGRLDTHTYAEFDGTLAPILGDPTLTSLILDLSELSYISSAGIRSIFKARKALSVRSGKFLIANPQPQIQKVFDMVKAVPLGDIFSSVAEADAYLDAIQRKMVEGDAE
jgi:anti-anti-sigma factor